jgi:uncharacterized protein YbjT (DUF2867 family)
MNMQNPDRLYLVTGASGYVGGRLVRVLLEDKKRVRVLVRDAKKIQSAKEMQVMCKISNAL